MRLTSTVAEYQALARIEGHASRLRAWTTDYEAGHRDVFDVYYRSYSDPCRRAGAAADVARISPLVREREAWAEALARQAEQEFRARGLLDELNVVLLVGNRTANAWVAQFRGRQSMFVALELLGAPPYDGVLFCHEALHLAHMHHGAATWPDDVGACLVQEGVATAASRVLHPGLSDSGYLWNDDQHDRWVGECREAGQALAAVVLAELATPPRRHLMSRACSREAGKPRRCLRGPATGSQICWRNTGHRGTASGTRLSGITQRLPAGHPATSAPG